MYNGRQTRRVVHSSAVPSRVTETAETKKNLLNKLKNCFSFHTLDILLKTRDLLRRKQNKCTQYFAQF